MRIGAATIMVLSSPLTMARASGGSHEAIRLLDHPNILPLFVVPLLLALSERRFTSRIATFALVAVQLGLAVLANLIAGFISFFKASLQLGGFLELLATAALAGACLGTLLLLVLRPPPSNDVQLTSHSALQSTSGTV